MNYLFRNGNRLRKSDWTSIVSLLLKEKDKQKKCNLQLRDVNGNTPLHCLAVIIIILLLLL